MIDCLGRSPFRQFAGSRSQAICEKGCVLGPASDTLRPVCGSTL
jgi:hypothetical protein